MNTTLKRALVVGTLLSAASLAPKAQAQTVSYYDFGTTSSGAAPTTFTATTGNGTLTVVGFTTGTTATSNVVFFGGTTINAQSTTTPNAALALLGGTTIAGPPASAGNNGAYIQFNADTTGLANVGISFATQKTSTGFNSDQLFYSFDGGVTFTPFGAAYTPAAAFALQSFDLTSIPALGNNPLDVFRITFTGATSASGNNRIDNLTVGTPVAAAPEPSGTASILIGAALMGGLLCAARRRTAGQPQAA